VPKILAQSGTSLADVYDIEGSIAGVEELLSKDVHLSHEMGATIFSERIVARQFVIETGAIAQTITFNVSETLEENARILGAVIGSNAAARVLRASLSVESTADLQDVPFYVWSSVTDGFAACQVLIAGAVLTLEILQPAVPPTVPNLLIGNTQRLPANTITLRGITTTFGAGTVQIRALVYLALPQVGGISSRGLPLPGW